MEKYELLYVEWRLSTQGEEMVPEKKTEIIEADSYDEAELTAGLFLAGRKMISLRCLHLPEHGTVVQPKPEFIPEDELYDHCSRF